MTKKNLIKYIILSSLVILLLLISYFIFLKKDEEVVIESQEEATNWEDLPYSRVSFFNTSEHRASINIPERWEGSYRMREENGSANFYYLDNEAGELLMFSIKPVPVSERSENTTCVSGEVAFDLEVNDFELPDENDMEGIMKHIKSTLKCY